MISKAENIAKIYSKHVKISEQNINVRLRLFPCLVLEIGIKKILKII